MPRARPRAPRVDPSNQRPLDDGTRHGPELWTDRAGVSFCHWDRWLARLALDEPRGLDAVADELDARMRASHRTRDRHEMLLTQARDLAERLATAGIGVAELLDDVERESVWLRDKAHRRVWDGRSIVPTVAMRNTPTARLEARAATGHWAAFPVSPELALRRMREEMPGQVHVDWRIEPVILSAVEFAIDELLARASTEDAALAVHRAVLTHGHAIVEALPDQNWELCELVHEHEVAYGALLARRPTDATLIRDFVERMTWDEYGIFERAERTLLALRPDAATTAAEWLAAFAEELQAADLAHLARRARTLRSALTGSPSSGHAPGPRAST